MSQTFGFKGKLDGHLETAILAVSAILQVDPADTIIDDMVPRLRRMLTPAQRRDPSSAYSVEVLRMVEQCVKETYGMGRKTAPPTPHYPKNRRTAKQGMQADI